MAFEKRTVEQIETAMIANKESRAELDVLDSTSLVSVWRNMIYSFAVSASLHEGAFADFLDSVNERSFEVIQGTSAWYASESLSFQFGDQLEITNNVISYQTIDEEKQIIKLAAADKEGGALILKVAKLDESGTPVQLDSSELLAFNEYWSKKQFACVPIDYRSQPGDIGIFSLRIGVDTSIINKSNGESLTESGVFPVEDAINNYLKTYQNINFSGLFRLVDFVDAIQSVTGVFNVVVNDTQIKPYNGEFISLLDDENKEYVSQSGYIVVDEQNGLKDTITYY